MECLYFFCMYGKRRPIAISWYQISIPQAFIFQVHRRRVPPPWLDVLQQQQQNAWLDVLQQQQQQNAWFNLG